MMRPAPLRKTGLDVLGDRPWGTHFCVFYETNDDLVEMLDAVDATVKKAKSWFERIFGR